MALTAPQQEILAALEEGGFSLSIEQALAKKEIPWSRYAYHRDKHPEFAEAVKALQARHRAMVRVARETMRIEVIDPSVRPPAPESEEPKEEVPPPPLEPRIEEWLEVYEQTREQVKALDEMAARGAPVDYDEIEAHMKHPAFRKRFMAVQRLITLRALDTLHTAGGKNHQAALKILAAEMPEKYGNRVKVDHTHRHELVDGDEGDLEQMDRWLGRHLSKQRHLPAVTDVIEGEVL